MCDEKKLYEWKLNTSDQRREKKTAVFWRGIPTSSGLGRRQKQWWNKNTVVV